MAIEIERKFLLTATDWLSNLEGTAYKQGYLLNSEDTTVRVRVAGRQGFLTIKARAAGLARPEYEYEIPLQDAEELLKLCPNTIDKTRHKVKVGRHSWDVDLFHGENGGLSLAEVELSDPEESFEKPAWLGQEVTNDKRYFNAYLVNHPYKSWK
ncbi:MAG: CYTH domain-containing protein [Trueperaceae bacterium]|nr:CYTH domain-containing protein [Trueperaceae bacterium]